MIVVKDKIAINLDNIYDFRVRNEMITFFKYDADSVDFDFEDEQIAKEKFKGILGCIDDDVRVCYL